MMNIMTLKGVVEAVLTLNGYHLEEEYKGIGARYSNSRKNVDLTFNEGCSATLKNGQTLMVLSYVLCVIDEETIIIDNNKSLESLKRAL